MLSTIFAFLLLVHGAIHTIGIARSVERRRGSILTWIVATIAFGAAGILSVASSEYWWIAALPALIASIISIAGSWSDARLGMIPNAIVLVPLAIAIADLRPSSLRSIYHQEVARGLARRVESRPPIAESELAVLPAPVATYLRRAGVVGKPHVHNFRAIFTGTIRNDRDADWMPIEVEQYEFFPDPARLFIIESTFRGVPFEALHVYTGAAATMRVRAVSLIDLADARGPEMNRAETVTLFNDLVLLAPATLVDARVVWRPLSERRVRGIFSNAGNTISADLFFDENGDLSSFYSEDRYLTRSGTSYASIPWETPVRDYREYRGVRLAAHGDAIWREPQGPWTYARFELVDIEYNVAR